MIKIRKLVYKYFDFVVDMFYKYTTKEYSYAHHGTLKGPYFSWWLFYDPLFILSVFVGLKRPQHITNDVINPPNFYCRRKRLLNF